MTKFDDTALLHQDSESHGRILGRATIVSPLAFPCHTPTERFIPMSQPNDASHVGVVAGMEGFAIFGVPKSPTGLEGRRQRGGAFGVEVLHCWPYTSQTCRSDSALGAVVLSGNLENGTALPALHLTKTTSRSTRCRRQTVDRGTDMCGGTVMFIDGRKHTFGTPTVPIWCCAAQPEGRSRSS
jgi:hypothetical protein